MAIIRAPKKSKWYVVWIGRIPGIYPSWEKCREQVEGFPGSRYRAYDTLADARTAVDAGPPKAGGSRVDESLAKGGAGKKSAKVKKPKKPITPSVSVDAACNMVTRVMEYRGVDTATGTELFRLGPFEDATNNIGEFLAIVHALGMLEQQKSTLPVYSDSTTALNWVRNKKARTKTDRTTRNRKVFELLERAELWLETNEYENELLKWESDVWGENPADFGRK
ncbi:MAG: ribonuclease H [Chlorobi bacterium]|nr:MAG: ribonuclease H [Bacteroidota bacterium]MBE2265919.1 ribonuclease H family protein [Flavobacteriales bacterium]MBL1160920.1 ribonuclease H [Chlorobiota bacterium]MBW7852881.1 viroplasmin family protein [Candidatus Kapabacteria bacterium]MCC6330888.1 ribonuclease H family protein [Ignavibacteria bacterium]